MNVIDPRGASEAQREALRDRFVAAALTGLLSVGWSVWGDEGLETVTRRAYACADAMMLRRAQPPADAPAPQTAP